MINERSFLLGSNKSVIRELFEYGRKRSAETGADGVCDFSLGNPFTPAPKQLDDAIIRIIRENPPLSVHGYTSAPGCDELRKAIASSLSKKHNLEIRPENLYISCGAAAALASTLGALTYDTDSEFIAIAPFFPDYRCFSETLGAKFRVVPADEEAFQINFEALESTITPNTQAVIINSPNNPSGVVYTEDSIKRLASILENKSREYGKPIYIVSDEPYREIVYGGVKVPFIPKYYKNTVICYSFSKSFSVPGERVGYVLVPDFAEDSAKLFNAVAGTAREFGYVCAPSLLQKAIAECIDVEPDISLYERNRNLLYNSLTEMGYICAKPDGAFYLFVRLPGFDGNEFSEKCKAHDVLIVPGASFGCPNFARISYCVDPAVCERALPVFKSVIENK